MAGFKTALFAAAAATGADRLFARTVARGRLAILMYHGVTPAPLPVPDWCFVPAAEFRAQMLYLARHCRVLPLGAALRALERGELKGDTRPAVAITFDDGYQNNYEVALPILREYNLPATIYLNTGFVGTDDWLWFCRLHDALSRTALRELSWRGERFTLGNVQNRQAASARLQALLKEQPHAALLAETAELVRQLGCDPAAPVAPDSPYRFLSSEAVQGCLRSGLVEFGAHTVHHTILAHLPADEQRREIADSVAGVAALAQRPCAQFAYPNGRPQDFTPETVRLLRECGVTHAVTTRELGNAPTSDALRLGRYGIGCGTPLALFRAQVHHLASRGCAA